MNSQRAIKLLISFFCLGIPSVFVGCEVQTTPDLFDPNYTSKPTPTIASLSPDTALSGVTVITITGANFSTVPRENFVFFNGKPGNVITSSQDTLTVRPPVMEGDSIKVKVSVFGSEFFSNVRNCYLRLAVRSMGGFSTVDEPWATAVDSAGNIYVSVVSNAIGVGVKKFAFDGTKSDYAPKLFETKYSSMKFGPDRVLYASWNVRALAQVPGNMANPVLWVQFPTGTKIYSFDFDVQGNIWAGGENSQIYRVKPDKSVKSFPLNANIRSVRVFNNFVYFTGTMLADSLEKVVRYRIVSADSLGPQEVVFDLPSSGLASSGVSLLAMNFSANGNLFLGTNLSDPVIVVQSGGTAQTFYPGLLTPSVHLLVWGKGTELLAVRGASSGGAITSSGQIFRINTQIQGTP